MKIFDKRVPFTISISLLNEGECFQLDGDYYIKTDSSSTDVNGLTSFTCVNLDDGSIISLASGYQCIPINTKLYILEDNNE